MWECNNMANTLKNRTYGQYALRNVVKQRVNTINLNIDLAVSQIARIEIYWGLSSKIDFDVGNFEETVSFRLGYF